MNATKISATELRSRTRDVIERVRFRGEHFIIQTFGKPVAVILNLDEYNLLLDKVSRLNPNSNEEQSDSAKHVSLEALNIENR